MRYLIALSAAAILVVVSMTAVSVIADIRVDGLFKSHPVAVASSASSAAPDEEDTRTCPAQIDMDHPPLLPEPFLLDTTDDTHQRFGAFVFASAVIRQCRGGPCNLVVVDRRFRRGTGYLTCRYGRDYGEVAVDPAVQVTLRRGIVAISEPEPVPDIDPIRGAWVAKTHSWHSRDLRTGFDDEYEICDESVDRCRFRIEPERNHIGVPP